MNEYCRRFSISITETDAFPPDVLHEELIEASKRECKLRGFFHPSIEAGPLCERTDDLKWIRNVLDVIADTQNDQKTYTIETWNEIVNTFQEQGEDAANRIMVNPDSNTIIEFTPEQLSSIFAFLGVDTGAFNEACLVFDTGMGIEYDNPSLQANHMHNLKAALGATQDMFDSIDVRESLAFVRRSVPRTDRDRGLYLVYGALHRIMSVDRRAAVEYMHLLHNIGNNQMRISKYFFEYTLTYTSWLDLRFLFAGTYICGLMDLITHQRYDFYDRYVKTLNQLLITVTPSVKDFIVVFDAMLSMWKRDYSANLSGVTYAKLDQTADGEFTLPTMAYTQHESLAARACVELITTLLMYNPIDGNWFVIANEPPNTNFLYRKFNFLPFAECMQVDTSVRNRIRILAMNP
jgi:hypothetical protein